MKYIAILSSGTGGHVYPAYRIAEEYIKLGYRIIWIGTENGLENRVIKNKSITIKHVSSRGIRGKSFMNKIIGLLLFIKAIYESFFIIREYKPCLVFGFGGYVSVAATISAFILRKPIVLHEQNAIAGTSNKINYYFVKKVFETFPLSFNKSNHKIIHTGNPVRQKLLHLEKPELKYLSDKSFLNILIMGGSQGSSFLNKVLPFALSHFYNNNISIEHIAGMNNKDSVKLGYNKYKINATVHEYSDNIEKLFNWSSLVICRAGSTSISELAVIGRASILVPFPFATDNHQLKNAYYLANNSATILLQQEDNFVENFVNTLNIILNDQKRLYTLSKNVQKIFPEDTVKTIIDESLKIVD